MRLLLQRVSSGGVTVAGEIVSQINAGVVVLVGISREDTIEDAQKLATLLSSLPLFWNSEKQEYETLLSNPSKEVLLVSQFTLCAVFKGRKPDFHLAMPPKDAKPFYEHSYR